MNMNERIKELAELSIKESGQEFWWPPRWLTNDLVIEKFAELIVRECMSYMEDGDIDFAKFMIKKNFGVEE